MKNGNGAYFTLRGARCQDYMLEQESTGKKNKLPHVYINEGEKKASHKDLTVKQSSFIIVFCIYPQGVS
jgi:hypothetical protein